MKRSLFLSAIVVFCGQQLIAYDVSDGIHQEAHIWATEATQINQEERLLMANVLRWSVEITKIDILLRNYMRGFVALNRSICENALTCAEQTISFKDAAKTIATFLKISQNYRTTYNAWTLCNNFIEDNPQSEQFHRLLEQLKKSIRKSILTFLKNNSTTVDALVEKNREQLAQIGQEITLGMRVFCGLLQETSPMEAGDQQRAKANILGQAADFMWEKSFAGVEAALHASRPQELSEEISKTLFVVYQEKFLNSMQESHPDQILSVMFQEEVT